jgi:hypothetical protein
MIQNKIVVRYQDGRVMKGITSDFMPFKDIFHLVPMDAAPGTKPLPVALRELKAIFFVKDFVGDPQHQDKREFDSSKPIGGRRIKVVFRDGELLIGTTQGYQPGRPGFFVIPVDPKSNCDRCFVVSSATAQVSLV